MLDKPSFPATITIQLQDGAITLDFGGGRTITLSRVAAKKLGNKLLDYAAILLDADNSIETKTRI